MATVELMSDDRPQHPIPDELKVDVDQDALAEWDEVSDKYAGDGEEDKRRPVFADGHTSKSSEDEGPEDDSDTDDTSDSAEH